MGVEYRDGGDRIPQHPQLTLKITTMKTAIVKFAFNGKILDVRATCGDTKGLSDALIGEKLEAQICKKFRGATIIAISFEN